MSLDKWNNLVITKVLKSNNLGIASVCNFNSLYTLNYSVDNYEQIKGQIERKRFETMDQFKDFEGNGFSAYIEIVEFSDQLDRRYFLTVYDSDELYHDPELIDIFPQKEHI